MHSALTDCKIISLKAAHYIWSDQYESYVSDFGNQELLNKLKVKIIFGGGLGGWGFVGLVLV